MISKNFTNVMEMLSPSEAFNYQAKLYTAPKEEGVIMDKEITNYIETDIAVTREACRRMMNFRYGLSIKIKKVIFNDPATIVFWADGSKTVVKCGDGDIFDPEKGLAMAISKRCFGDKGSYYNEFKKWLPEEEDGKNDCLKMTVTESFAGATIAMDDLANALDTKGKNMRIMSKKKQDEILKRIAACQIICNNYIFESEAYIKMTEHLANIAIEVVGTEGATKVHNTVFGT